MTMPLGKLPISRRQRHFTRESNDFTRNLRDDAVI